MVLVMARLMIASLQHADALEVAALVRWVEQGPAEQ